MGVIDVVATELITVVIKIDPKLVSFKEYASFLAEFPKNISFGQEGNSTENGQQHLITRYRGSIIASCITDHLGNPLAYFVNAYLRQVTVQKQGQREKRLSGLASSLSARHVCACPLCKYKDAVIEALQAEDELEDKFTVYHPESIIL